MTLRLDDDSRNVMADGLVDQFDGGTLIIYTGTQPASANDAPTGTVLATITLPTPAFGAAAAGVVAKSGTWQDVSADATGTAGWFRVSSAAGPGTYRWDGSVTATGGGGDMELDTTSITAGGTVTVSTCQLTMPAA